MASKTTVQVDVTGDARDAIKALGDVTAKMGTMQQKAVAVGSAIGSVLGAGVSKVIDVFKDLGGEILEQSDSIQKFQSTMGFAGFDTKAIDAATKATKAYADQTVYDLTTVQNTTAQLAANGVKDYVGLTKAAGNLNAVAGGNADTFGSVAMVLTQTAGAGKLTTENWNQLADAIPGASGRLQEAMKANGAYVGNFRDAMEDGQISADEFNQALQQLGMEDVAQKAATSTATFEGAWGNLMASLTGGAAELVNIFKPAITDSIGWAAEQIGTWFTNAKNTIQDFITGLQSTLDLTTVSTMFDAIATAVGTMGTAFVTVAETIAPALTQIGGAGSIGSTVGTAFNLAAVAVTMVANGLTMFGEWVSANADGIATAIVAIGTAFAVWKVASLISGVVTALKSFSLATNAAAIAQQALNLVMNANPIMIIITLLASLTAALVYFFTQTETGRQIWSGFTSFMGDAVNKIIGFFQSLPGKISAFFNDAVAGAKGIWNGFTGWIGGIWDKIVNGAQKIVGGIRNAFSDAVNAAKSVLDSLVSKVRSIWDTITGIVGKITGAISNAWDTVTGLLPFSAAPMRAMAMAGVGMTPMAMPVMAVGGADSQGASHGARSGATLTDLVTALSKPRTTDAKTTIINLTVQLSDLTPDPDRTARKIIELIDRYEDRRR